MADRKAIKAELEKIERCQALISDMFKQFGFDAELFEYTHKLHDRYWILNNEYLMDLENEARALCRLTNR
jgi:hypothetical protein